MFNKLILKVISSLHLFSKSSFTPSKLWFLEPRDALNSSFKSKFITFDFQLSTKTKGSQIWEPFVLKVLYFFFFNFGE